MVTTTYIDFIVINTNSIYDTGGWNTYLLRYNEQELSFNVYLYSDPNTYTTDQGTNDFFDVTQIENPKPSPNTDNTAQYDLLLDLYTTMEQDYIEISVINNGENYVLGQTVDINYVII